MAELRRGQKVRVTYEAYYQEPSTTWPGGSFVVSTIDGERRGFHAPADAVIEPIEDLRPGDIYLTADGLTVVLADQSCLEPEPSVNRPWVIATEEAYKAHRSWWLRDIDIKRPLTLLVRDGKPVQS